MSNQQDLYDATGDYKAKHGQPALRALLDRVAGVFAASDVPNHLIGAVIGACRNDPPMARKEARTVSQGINLRGETFANIIDSSYDTWNNPKKRRR